MITIERLEEKNACKNGIEAFTDLLPNGGDLEKCVYKLIRNEYIGYAFWLIDNFADEYDVKPLLRKLTNHSNLGVVYYVTKNPNTPEDVLKKLSNHHDIFFVWEVAKNPNTPQEVKEKIEQRLSRKNITIV